VFMWIHNIKSDGIDTKCKYDKKNVVKVQNYTHMCGKTQILSALCVQYTQTIISLHIDIGFKYFTLLS